MKNSAITIINLCMILFIMIPFNISSQTIHNGDTLTFGGGSAFTWVETDDLNAPVRIGLSLTYDAVDKPGTGRFSLTFPRAASDSLFQHMFFAFEPEGHGPSKVYSLPHFDFHFYMISDHERGTIDQGVDNTLVPDEYMPEDYIPVDNYFSVYQMGVHFVDRFAGEFNGKIFDKTMIYGFYRAKMLFVEPMITRELLLTKPDTTISIKQPASYQRNAYYPQKYTVRYIEEENLYEIFITDFEYRNTLTSVSGTPEGSTLEYSLHQNYPNPFNPTTVIKFSISETNLSQITLYDALGREVKVLMNEVKEPGNHEIEFNAKDLTSGVYFYRLSSGNYNASKKLLLLK